MGPGVAEITNIPWCDSTFNPVLGCIEVSPGCDNCYAREFARVKFPAVKWGAGQPRYRTSEANWQQPLRWDRKAEKDGKRHTVFCGSLCDVFDNEWPEETRGDLWRLIRATPALTWLLLTKRAGNIAKMHPGGEYQNVWLGATVCNQEEAARDISKLLAVPAAMHWLSCEPLLGPINLSPWLTPIGVVRPDPHGRDRAVRWVVVGAESGPKRRPFDHAWLRSIVEQCKSAGVSCFVKQDSSLRPGARGKIPDDLWIREFPV